MAKISKSVQIQKGKKVGYEQVQELLRAFNEKTGVISEDGTVKEVFKIVIEIDEAKIRTVTPEIERYLKFKDNTAVRTMNDPGDGIAEDITVEIEAPSIPNSNGYFAYDADRDGDLDKEEEVETVEVKPKKKTSKKK